MKKLIMMAAVMAGCINAFAQTIVKPHEIPWQDSIVYQVETAIIIFDKVDVDNYFKGLDTILAQEKYSKKVFRNIQFAHLSAEEVQRHWGMASKFWNSAKTSPMSYSTDKITLFWNDNEGIILPYLDEILPELLESGRVQVVDRSTGKRVKQYKIDYEDVDLKAYKIFKFEKGRIIWRESEVFLEQFNSVGR